MYIEILVLYMGIYIANRAKMAEIINRFQPTLHRVKIWGLSVNSVVYTPPPPINQIFLYTPLIKKKLGPLTYA